MAGPAEFDQSPKRSFRLCSRDDSQGKLFIGMMLNVILFGVKRYAGIYLLYPFTKVRNPYSNNSSLSLFVCLFSEIDWGSKFRWANGIRT
jgi:hypothetical protein